MAENIRSNLFVDLWVHIRHRWVDLYFLKTKNSWDQWPNKGFRGGLLFYLFWFFKKGGKENFLKKIKRQMFQLTKITLASSRRRCLIICVWMSTSFWWRVSCPSVINLSPQRTHTHTTKEIRRHWLIIPLVAVRVYVRRTCVTKTRDGGQTLFQNGQTKKKKKKKWHWYAMVSKR